MPACLRIENPLDCSLKREDERPLWFVTVHGQCTGILHKRFTSNTSKIFLSLYKCSNPDILMDFQEVSGVCYQRELVVWVMLRSGNTGMAEDQNSNVTDTFLYV